MGYGGLRLDSGFLWIVPPVSGQWDMVGSGYIRQWIPMDSPTCLRTVGYGGLRLDSEFLWIVLPVSGQWDMVVPSIGRGFYTQTHTTLTHVWPCRTHIHKNVEGTRRNAEMHSTVLTDFASTS